MDEYYVKLQDEDELEEERKMMEGGNLIGGKQQDDFVGLITKIEKESKIQRAKSREGDDFTYPEADEVP